MNVKIGKGDRLDNFPSGEAVWFWSIAGFFAVLWVLIPTLLYTAYSADVIEIQNAAPEWVWATKKHPMLPAWILEVLNILTGRAFAVPFIAVQLCTLLTLWSMWKMGRTVLNGRLALVAALATLPSLLCACCPIWYNQNTVLIALWALSLYLSFQALQTNQKRYWISAGIALGLALHAKYPAIFLAVSIIAYMVTHTKERRYLRTPGPYITILITCLIFLPHVIWLFYHDFPTLAYVADRPPMSRWISPLHFVGGQLFYWFPTLLVLIPMIGPVWKWKVQHHEQDKVKECEQFLFYCFIIPLALYMLYGGIKGDKLRMEYGAPLWVSCGLWLLLRFQHIQEPVRSFRQTMTIMITFMFFLAVGFVACFYLGLQNPKRYLPMRELGAACEQLWRKQGFSVHCPYTVGEHFLLSGHAAYAMTARPSVIVPWSTWASDDDLNRRGGMIVWERKNDESDIPEELRRRFPDAKVLPEAPELPYKVGRKIHVLKIGVAIVPPAESEPQSVGCATCGVATFRLRL